MKHKLHEGIPTKLMAFQRNLLFIKAKFQFSPQVLSKESSAPQPLKAPPTLLWNFIGRKAAFNGSKHP